MITPLGGIDGLFLHLETRTMPMHVGSMHVYRLPRRFSGDFTTRLRHHLAERLHLSPVFTRRLAPMPLRLSNPAWIDADRVDLAYHVREIRLPAPGDAAALQDCVARLHAEPMDRDRPLWQFHVLQGLDLPGCIGFYGKVHHAALDGQAAVAMVQAFLDVHATPRAVAPPPPGPDHVPGPGPLMRAVAAHQLHETRRVFALLPALATVNLPATLGTRRLADPACLRTVGLYRREGRVLSPVAAAFCADVSQTARRIASQLGLELVG